MKRRSFLALLGFAPAAAAAAVVRPDDGERIAPPSMSIPAGALPRETIIEFHDGVLHIRPARFERDFELLAKAEAKRVSRLAEDVRGLRRRGVL